MSFSNHVIRSFLASLTFASSALAQGTTYPAPPPPQPAPKDNVADLTDTTMTSPPAATAATPAPVASATVPNSIPPFAPEQKPVSVVAQPAAVAQQSASPAVDPESNIRHGFYLRLDQGIGYVGITGNGPLGGASIKDLGSTSVITIGASIGRGVVLAGTLQAMSASATFKGGPFEGKTIVLSDRSVSASSKADAAFSQIGLLLDWFPNPAAGWHVGASGGVGTISIVNRADESTLYGFGFTGTLFGGYDWQIAKTWSFGLSMVASGITTSTIKYSDDAADTGYRLHGLSLGVSGSILYF